MFIGLGQCRLYRGFVANIDLQGQRLAACRLNFQGHAMDGPGQLGVGLRTFGGDHDIGPVPCGTQCYLTADPATGAGNEQGFTL
ncbi:hypothetical protein D3C73_1521220 [compost metagenome]